MKEKRTVEAVFTFTFSCLGGAKGDPEEDLRKYHPLLLVGGIASKGVCTKAALASHAGTPPPLTTTTPTPSPPPQLPWRSPLSLSQRRVDTASVSSSTGT